MLLSQMRIEKCIRRVKALSVHTEGFVVADEHGVGSPSIFASVHIFYSPPDGLKRDVPFDG